MADRRECSRRKIVSHGRDQAKPVYYGAVLKAKKEIPDKGKYVRCACLGAKQPGVAAEPPLAVIEEYTEKMRREKLELLGRFKANRIQRSAALDTIRSMHEAMALDDEKDIVRVTAAATIARLTSLPKTGLKKRQ